MFCKCKVNPCCTGLFLSLLLSRPEQQIQGNLQSRTQVDNNVLQQQQILNERIAALSERQMELERQLEQERLKVKKLVNDSNINREKETTPVRHYRSCTQTICMSPEMYEIARKMSFVAHEASQKGQERIKRIESQEKNSKQDLASPAVTGQQQNTASSDAVEQKDTASQDHEVQEQSQREQKNPVKD